MSMPVVDTLASPIGDPIEYPDSDGNLMSDNSTHADAIEYFHGVVGSIVADDPDAFCALDHLWYYREGDVAMRVAPDVYVVFGRPKRHRGRYLQWEEAGIAPQIVFEVVSPNNRRSTAEKFFLYSSIGVEEYVVYDPGYNWRGDLDVGRRSLKGFLRNQSGKAEVVEDMTALPSPRLGISYGWGDDGLLNILRPDGTPFPRYTEAVKHANELQMQLSAMEAKLDRLRTAGVDVDGAP